MPAMNTAFYEKILSILTPAQKAELGEWTILQQGGITAAPIANTATRSTRKAATRTRTTKMAAAPTGNGAALLSYLQQHPTAAYTQAQLREISPFKNWRPNVLGRALGTLTNAGNLIKKGNAWQFSNVDRTMTRGDGRRRGARTRRTRTANAEAQPLAATG